MSPAINERYSVYFFLSPVLKFIQKTYIMGRVEICKKTNI